MKYLGLPEILLEGSSATTPDFERWLFESFHIARLREDPLKWGTPKGIAEAAIQFFDHMSEMAQDQIVLADIKLNQLYIAEGWFHEPTSAPRLLHKAVGMGKIIFLRRKNLLRAILSALQAQKTGVWHNWGQLVASNDPITVDSSDLLRRVEIMDRGLSEAERWLGDSKFVHRVWYEDLFNTETMDCNQKAFDSISNFMGMRQGINWHSQFRKTGTKPIASVVENFKELREVFLPTRFAEMLEAD